MSLIVYKVIFKGNIENEIKDLTITFKEISYNEPINVSPKFISMLKRLSQASQNIINFQNIKEVIRIGENTPGFLINYYIVLLYITKLNGNKKGFLIGNVKKKGDILLGIWPFTQKSDILTSEEIDSIFNDLIAKPQNYSKICLIYS
ncbi:MAG: hypothetical protein ACXACC_04935 [Promethearchaeota archaeon]|jgi:hypothetical protein